MRSQKSQSASKWQNAAKGQNGVHGANGMVSGINGENASERELWVRHERDEAYKRFMERCVTPNAASAPPNSSHVHRSVPHTHSIQINDESVTLMKGAHLIVRNNGSDGEDGSNGQNGAIGGEGGDGCLTEQGEHHLRDLKPNEHLDERRDYVAPGEGGDGGNGGHGGNGGNGGDSASVVLSAADARLFLLLKTEIRAGKGGTAGRGGLGGEGGEGGLYPYYYGRLSNKEMRAQSGRKGMDGQNGMDGRDGWDRGKVVYRVFSDETKAHLIEEGNSCFNVRIEGCAVRALNDDGIIEPGEELLLENISLKNIGGISLPEGCRLSVKPLECIEYATSIMLPRVAPNETLHLHTAIQIKITENCLEPKQNTGSLSNVTPKKQLSLQLQACFDGFEDYLFPPYTHSPLFIQYPVRIHSVQCASTLGRGSQAQLRIGIQNLSFRSFGCDMGAEFAVHYRIRLGDDVHFYANEHSDVHYVSHLAPSGNILPPSQGSLNTQDSALEFQEHTIILGYSLPFYESTSIYVDLYIRQKEVEHRSHSIKVVPLFREDLIPVSDVLFFTNRDFTAASFEYFDRVFQLLQLEVNYFDTDHYEGYTNNRNSNQAPQWEGKFAGKLLILPVTKNHNHWLSGLDPQAIENHFENSQESGMLVVGDTPPDRKLLFSYLKGQMVRTLSPQEFDSHYLFYSPSEKDMREKMTEIELQEYQNSALREHFVVHSAFEPEQIRGGIVRWRYTFGKKATLHRLMLECHHRFLFAHSPHSEWASQKRHVDKALMFQLLCGISFERRLQLLDTDLFGSKEMSQKELHKLIISSMYAELYRLLSEKRIQKHIDTIDYLFSLYPSNKHIQLVFGQLHRVLQSQRRWRGNTDSAYHKQLVETVENGKGSSEDKARGLCRGLRPRFLLDILEQKAMEEQQEYDRADRRKKMMFIAASVMAGLVGWMMWRHR